MNKEYKSPELSGTLFHNNKGDNEARPDFRGEITIDGRSYSLSSWIRKDKAGRDYMSIKATPPMALVI